MKLKTKKGAIQRRRPRPLMVPRLRAFICVLYKRPVAGTEPPACLACCSLRPHAANSCPRFDGCWLRTHVSSVVSAFRDNVDGLEAGTTESLRENERKKRGRKEWPPQQHPLPLPQEQDPSSG